MPPTSPKLIPAATLILVRDKEGSTKNNQSGIEVLLVRRSQSANFASGLYVFPGGKLDSQDQAHIWENMCMGINTQTLNDELNLDDHALAYYVCAIRECFEETGYFLGYSKGEPRHTPLEDTSLQLALAQKKISFTDLCQNHDCLLDMTSMKYFSHWITPEGLPKRFDTRFFIASPPRFRLGGLDQYEVIDEQWLSPETALKNHKNKQMPMMFPTLKTLVNLSGYSSIKMLYNALNRQPRPTTQQPILVEKNGRKVPILPN